MRQIYCQKLNKTGEGLDRQPYPGELGKRVYENISKEAWAMWLAHQTTLINEYRLSMAESKDRQLLVKEMEKFLFTNESIKPEGYTQKT
ncbi:MAG: oxidative damage protection protein [Legionellales bacterium]|nr:oxidative damage protection protein [Legionellales bacterium]